MRPSWTLSTGFMHRVTSIGLASHARMSAVLTYELPEAPLFDVEELPTHGGSLRVYCCHVNDSRHQKTVVQKILNEEEKQGLQTLTTYLDFQRKTDHVKNGLLTFLIKQKHSGKKIAAYGAAAKGNTLLNYAGIKSDLLPYVCDAASSKQGKYLPGSHIPILPPSALSENKPDIILILPWNIADEIVQQHAYVQEWGGIFVSAVPEIKVIEFKS